MCGIRCCKEGTDHMQQQHTHFCKVFWCPASGTWNEQQSDTIETHHHKSTRGPHHRHGSHVTCAPNGVPHHYLCVTYRNPTQPSPHKPSQARLSRATCNGHGSWRWLANSREHAPLPPSMTYMNRKSVESRSKSIEHLSNIDLKSILHLSNIYLKSIEHLDINRTSI